MIEGGYSEDEAEALLSLVERLSAIAPVYYSIGNHDVHIYSETIEMSSNECVWFIGRTKFLDRLEEAGAVFLEADYVDTEINGDSVRIGGLYSFAYRYVLDSDENWEKRRLFLEDFCDYDGFKVMLSHRPESFIEKKGFAWWDLDVILSGHTHNGLIANPFTHRAIWTTEGFFPEHAYGEFDLDGMRMIITSGLAGWRIIPRVFNPPEIAVVDIVPAD